MQEKPRRLEINRVELETMNSHAQSVSTMQQCVFSAFSDAVQRTTYH